MSYELLTVGNAKTVKGEKKGYLTAILYLVPSDGSGLGNLCPHASAGCRAACLYSAGRGVMKPVIDGRMRKTKLFFENSASFVDTLVRDIIKIERRAKRQKMQPVIRLNGTSDIPWERIRGTNGLTVMEQFPHIQFYDYTKRPNRDPIWANYHLTFSRSESNEGQALYELAKGRNVAVVFNTRRSQPLPTSWNGFRVINGDESDLRFLDPNIPYGVGVVVGLRAKGKATKDHSGFVILSEVA